MKDQTQNLLAKFLSLRPVVSALKAYAKRRPYGDIVNNGDLYMGRSILIDNPAGLHARLHHIARPDHDRDLHNHPFEYRTYVVQGWYDEVYLDAKGRECTRRIEAGQTQHSSGSFHRIAAVSPGGAWTVFVMGKDRGSWGFRVPNGYSARWPYKQKYKFVDSKSYFLMRGINADGTDQQA